VRLGERGLLDERLGDEGARARRFAAFDVAESRLRLGRRDAERHETALTRKLGAALDRGGEGRFVADEVIRGEHEHHGVVAITRTHQVGGDRDGGSGVASEGLEEVRGVARLGVGEACVDVPRVEVQVPVGNRHESVAAGNCHARRAVLPSSVSPSGSGMNGLGAVSRESGHRRVPAPPERMTGTMAVMRDQERANRRFYRVRHVCV
jgi:hypothetical protein